MTRIELFKNDKYNESLTYQELRKLRERLLYRYAIVDIQERDFRIIIRERRLCFAGRKHYIKNVETMWFMYKNKTIHGSSFAQVIGAFGNKRPDILHDLGLDWMKELSFFLLEFASKKTIAISIFNKSIYNQETFVKAIGKRLYNLKTFSWRILRDYIEKTNCCVPICNIRDFTTNVDHTLQRLTNDTTTVRELLSDMIRLASIEDKVINARWSLKRLQEEHSKQIWRERKDEIDSKKIAEIYSNETIQKLSTNSIKLLSNEKDVYLETLNMHHCLYSCYWDCICQKSYMAFHMTQPEDCTFGVKYKDVSNSICSADNLCLDQIYLKYDKPVMDSTRAIAEQYIKDRSEYISKILISVHPNVMPTLPF